MTYFLRTPGQSSINFGLGTLGATRPKGLFYVRFRRPVSRYTTDIDDAHELGFIVKSVEQPKITAKTEEANQYNKKRFIHTGYDVSPVTIVLYDTMRQTAQRLWSSYLANHFGDFRHDAYTDWQPDQIQNTMVADDLGYGLAMPEDTVADNRYYFTAIDIIQVYGGEYTQTSLINPRIQQFDPEELNYEDMAPATFRMQVIYETVMYQDMRPLTADPELAEIFASPEMAGAPLEIIDVRDPPVSHWSDFAGEIIATTEPTLGQSLRALPNIIENLSARVGSGGVLGTLGEFDFGSAATVATRTLLSGSTKNLAADLVYAGTRDRSLTNLVQIASKIGGVNTSVNSYDNARSSARSASRDPQGTMANQITAGLIKASNASQKTSPTAPSGQVKKSNPLAKGISLTTSALALVNAGRKASSFIGKRKK